MAQDFVDGDVFYTEKNGQYTSYKILKKRCFGEVTVLNVRVFVSLAHVPTESEIQNLGTMVGVTPIDAKGFPGATRLCNSPVTEEELSNYMDYLMLSGQFEEYVAEKAKHQGVTGQELFEMALSHYNTANVKLEQRDLEGAVQEYSVAVDLCPLLFEAFDNRGLAYLDLGLLDRAKDSFETSLQVNPNGELAKIKLEWIQQVRLQQATV
eukprot:Phypoly_transcript_18089.p1 GENE.Phypoly_transcript_18089~~Phypoly_transcript_18089.p1  ORF type:complete len:209 (+),score=39.40 Phypoly_transcript_18089:118-744(+)